MSVERNARVSVFMNMDSIKLASVEAEANIAKFTKRLDEMKSKGEANTLAYDTLSKKLDFTKQKLEGFKGMLDGTMGVSMDKARSSIMALSKQIQALPEGHEKRAGMVADLEEMNAEFKKMQQESAMAGASLKKAGETGSSAWGKWKDIAVGTFIGNTVQSAIQTVGSWISNIGTLRNEFESTLGNLSAITGATGKDLEYLRNQALQLGVQGKTSSTEWLEAFKLVGSAKPELLANGAALVEVTKAAKLLSAASGEELKVSVESLTDTLNQYGEEANKAKLYTDALAAGAKYGAAEVRDESASIKEFGTQAKSANISIYESVGAVELMAEKGLKGAEAGTKLRNVMLAMSAVKGLDKQALDSLAQYGVNTDLLQNKSKSLEERLTELSKIQNDNAALVKVFGKENFNAGQIILQNIPRYAELTAQVKEQGVASEQAKANTANFGYAASRLGNILETLIVAMRTPEFLTEWVNGLSSLFVGFGKITGAIDTSTEAVDAFKKQADKVASLEKSMNPLIERYDELKAKTILGKDEQVELNKVINSIAQAIPGAVTQWDKYGNAIGISSEKAKEFIELQKLILKVKNDDAIKETEKQIWKQNDAQKEYNRQLKATEEQILKISNSISKQKGRMSEDEIKKDLDRNDSALGEETGSLSQKTNRLNDLTESLEKLKIAASESRDKLTGLKGIVNELKGENLVAPKEGKATTTDSNAAIPGVNKDAEKEYDKLLKEFQDFEKEVAVIGGSATENEKAKLQQKYSDLLEKNQIFLKKKFEGEAEYEARYEAIMEQWRNDIAAIDKKGEETIIKTKEDLRKEFNSRTSQEYKQALLDHENFIEEKRQAIVTDFVSGNSTKKQYDDALRNLEKEDKEQLYQIALDYYKGDVQAAKDAVKFKEQLGNEDVKNAEKIEQEKKQLRIQITRETFAALGSLGNAFFGMQESKQNIASKKYFADENRKKSDLDKRLKAGSISQANYDKEIAKIDKDSKARENKDIHDQAVMKKKTASFNAGLNLATAIGSIWAEYPKFDGGIAMGIALAAAGVTFGAQIANISAMEVPPVNGYAVGTKSAAPGWAWVGEKGPELMRMNGGEEIKTNSDSMRMMASLPQLNYTAAAQSMAMNRNGMAGGDSFFSSGKADAFFNGQESSLSMLAAIHQELKKPNRSYVVYSDIKEKEKSINKVKNLSGAK